MERAGYWLHKWTDETSSFDPHGRWSGGLDCYERDYSMWIPDRIKPDDTVAVNDYIDRQFELSAEVADGLEVIDAADAQATIVALQADNRTYINERHDNMKQIEQLQADLAERTAELEAANKLLYKKNCELGRFETIISNLQAELERVRLLIKALPKVEGEVTVRDITALCWANDGTYGSINCKEQLVSLLQERQKLC